MGFIDEIKNTIRPIWHKLIIVLKGAVSHCKWAYGGWIAANAVVDPRKVVVSCNFGRGYLCNPKYISEAVERLFPGEFDIVVLVRKFDECLPSHLRQVRYGSLKAQRELATARFWIYNFRDWRYVPKSRNQIFIQAWHACLGAKKCERDVEEKLGEAYVRQAQSDGAETDLMISDNRLTAEVYQKSFWFNGPVLRCGTPRNRLLILGDPALKAEVRRKLGLADGVNLCLYAPTFRNDYSFDHYRFDFVGVANALRERFGVEFVLAYRVHPNMASLPRPSFFDGLIDASSYPDQQELLVASDALISDYSSIMDDYSLTNRPGFVYAPDLDDFNDERGLYYPLEARPYPVAKNSNELIRAISSFDESDFSQRKRNFFSFVGLEDDGRGDEVVARVIHELKDTTKTLSDVLKAKDIWPSS